jgi:hypothetical protein
MRLAGGPIAMMVGTKRFGWIDPAQDGTVETAGERPGRTSH